MVKRYSHAIYMAKSNGEKIFFCRRKIFFFANIVFTVFDPTDASVWNITCFYFFKNFFSPSPGNFYAIMSFLAPNTRYFTYILLLNIRLFWRKYFGHENRKKTIEIPFIILSISTPCRQANTNIDSPLQARSPRRGPSRVANQSLEVRCSSIIFPPNPKMVYLVLGGSTPIENPS